METVDNLSKDTFTVILNFLDFRDHYALFMTARKYRTWVWEYRYRKFQRQIDDIEYFKNVLIGQKLCPDFDYAEIRLNFPFKGDIIRLAVDYSFWWQSVPGWKLGELWTNEEYGYIFDFFKLLESDLPISQFTTQVSMYSYSWGKEWNDFYDKILGVMNSLNGYGEVHRKNYFDLILGKIYVNPFDDFNEKNIKFVISTQSFKFGEKRPSFITLRLVGSGIYLVEEDRETKLSIVNFLELCSKFDADQSSVLTILQMLGGKMNIRENNPFRIFLYNDFHYLLETESDTKFKNEDEFTLGFREDNDVEW